MFVSCGLFLVFVFVLFLEQELVMQSRGLLYVGGTKSPAVRWLGDRSRAMVGHRRERGGKMEVLAVGVQGTGPRPAH